jgi:hypothetical protein
MLGLRSPYRPRCQYPRSRNEAQSSQGSFDEITAAFSCAASLLVAGDTKQCTPDPTRVRYRSGTDGRW